MNRLVLCVSIFGVASACVAETPLSVPTRAVPDERNVVKANGVDLQLLDSLLRVKSVSRDVERLEESVDVLKSWLQARGVHCVVERNEKGMPALYASTTPGKTHDYLFVSHIDVVPADDAMFTPRREGDWIFARGACDTKGNVAVIAQVLANLAGRCSVGAMIATDEECGKIGTATPRMMIERGYVPRRMVIVGDSAGEEPGQLFVAEKGHAALRLVAHGRGGHSSRPWALDNPISKLCEGYVKFAEAWAAESSATGTWRTVVSPTIIAAGDTSNVVPDDAIMTLSCRFTTVEDYVRLCACMRRTSGCELIAPDMPYCLPVVNRDNDPEIKALFAGLGATIPGLRLGRMSAATDAAFYVRLGLPIVIFAVDGCEPHASGEKVSVSSMDSYVAAFTSFFEKMASKP